MIYTKKTGNARVLCGKSLRDSILADIKANVGNLALIRQLKKDIQDIAQNTAITKEEKQHFIDKIRQNLDVKNFLLDFNATDLDKGLDHFSKKYPVLPTNPALATVLVGHDPASQTYIRAKQKAAESVDFICNHYDLPSEISEKELLDLVDKLNQDKEIHGILVQLPLPEHIDTQKVIRAIDPRKDVDGFHPYNQGLLQKSFEQTMLAPCTPSGIMRILEYYQIETIGRHAVVVGRSQIVGRPIATMISQNSAKMAALERKKKLAGNDQKKDEKAFLLEKMRECRGGDATVTLAHRYSKDLKKITLLADLLIVAVGKPNLITADMVKAGAVVVDVGINYVDDASKKSKKRLVGDVDFVAVSQKASAITPVPGGVGPMTIAMLMENTLKAYKNQHVVPHHDGWEVRGEGNKNVTKVFETQKEAIELAEKIAKNQNSDTKIHGRDGKIRSGNSYGNDPVSSKDKK